MAHGPLREICSSLIQPTTPADDQPRQRLPAQHAPLSIAPPITMLIRIERWLLPAPVHDSPKRLTYVVAPAMSQTDARISHVRRGSSKYCWLVSIERTIYGQEGLFVGDTRHPPTSQLQQPPNLRCGARNTLLCSSAHGNYTHCTSQGDIDTTCCSPPAIVTPHPSPLLTFSPVTHQPSQRSPRQGLQDYSSHVHDLVPRQHAPDLKRWRWHTRSLARESEKNFDQDGPTGDNMHYSCFYSFVLLFLFSIF